MKEMIPRSNIDNYCQKLKPKDKPLDIHDSQVKGLVFRVAPNGSKSWILRYHYKEGDEWKQRNLQYFYYCEISSFKSSFLISSIFKAKEQLRCKSNWGRLPTFERDIPSARD